MPNKDEPLFKFISNKFRKHLIRLAESKRARKCLKELDLIYLNASSPEKAQDKLNFFFPNSQGKATELENYKITGNDDPEFSYVAIPNKFLVREHILALIPNGLTIIPVICCGCKFGGKTLINAEMTIKHYYVMNLKVRSRLRKRFLY